MFTTNPAPLFSVLGPAYVPERHFDTAHYDAENRRRRKESLSALAGQPCIGRSDYLPGSD
jgi:hypothetical protein